MLSRIENNQYTSSPDVKFNTVILQKLEEFEEIIEFKDIKINMLQKGHFIANMNIDLARVLISNLLRNAIKYNVQAGHIDITIDDNEIDIANSSNDGALNPDFIFKRFHKGTQDSQSNGLGLSIVKTILEKYSNLSISYDFIENLQHFTIKKIK